MATTMQPRVTQLYSSPMACPIASGVEVVAYFPRRSGMIVACNLSRQAAIELLKILHVYHHKYSINVEVCSAATYMVVLS